MATCQGEAAAGGLWRVGCWTIGRPSSPGARPRRACAQVAGDLPFSRSCRSSVPPCPGSPDVAPITPSRSSACCRSPGPGTVASTAPRGPGSNGSARPRSEGWERREDPVRASGAAALGLGHPTLTDLRRIEDPASSRCRSRRPGRSSAWTSWASRVSARSRTTMRSTGGTSSSTAVVPRSSARLWGPWQEWALPAPGGRECRRRCDGRRRRPRRDRGGASRRRRGLAGRGRSVGLAASRGGGGTRPRLRRWRTRSCVSSRTRPETFRGGRDAGVARPDRRDDRAVTERLRPAGFAAPPRARRRRAAPPAVHDRKARDAVLHERRPACHRRGRGSAAAKYRTGSGSAGEPERRGGRRRRWTLHARAAARVCRKPLPKFQCSSPRG